ncbi:uncharacterized protein LOC142327019 [Lycorma delicatula]|uniref:uncharacterized protein LOC142327019 n=1 Tax=Lycorma delicatula TaxID=130591 RepID=UPI003F516B43
MAIHHGPVRCTGLPRNPSQWNVQVVRGKVNTRCFWNACKALSFGLLLMVIGATMAIIGYYADQLSVGHEIKGNETVHIKHETKGFHLHNLSYAGPIVMGVGGFIVVAACVMTFEARDSAAKVVPTRTKYSSVHPHRLGKPSPAAAASSKLQSSMRSDSGRRNTGSLSRQWEQQPVLRVGSSSPMATDAMSRRALTAAFIQFSRNLQKAEIDRNLGQITLSKSPSAPNLAETVKPIIQNTSPFLSKPYVSPRIKQKRSRNSLHPTNGGCTLLNPHALLQRQALSMDNPDYNPYFSPPHSQQLSRQHTGSGKGSGGSKESLELELGASACTAHGSQASMAMDLHLPNDCPVTLRVKDKTRRSDTAKRHVFTRQRQIDIGEDDVNVDRRDTHSCSPRLPGYYYRGYDEIKPYYSRSTPHSRRQSMSKVSPTLRSNTTEEYQRPRSNTNEFLPSTRRNSVTTRRRKKCSRSNTTDEHRRRSSNQFDSSQSRRESSQSLQVIEKRPQLEPQSSSCSGRSLPCDTIYLREHDEYATTGVSLSAEQTPILTPEEPLLPLTVEKKSLREDKIMEIGNEIINIDDDDDDDNCEKNKQNGLTEKSENLDQQPTIIDIDKNKLNEAGE